MLCSSRTLLMTPKANTNSKYHHNKTTEANRYQHLNSRKASASTKHSETNEGPQQHRPNQGPIVTKEVSSFRITSWIRISSLRAILLCPSRRRIRTSLNNICKLFRSISLPNISRPLRIRVFRRRRLNRWPISILWIRSSIRPGTVVGKGLQLDKEAKLDRYQEKVRELLKLLQKLTLD